MRVLAMLAAYPPRQCVGSWMMTHGLLRALVQRGHHVDVVLSEMTGDAYELDGVNVWPRVDKADPFRFLANADVIVAHLGGASRATTLGQMCGLPVAHICHNTGDESVGALKRGGASLLVFNSQHMAARFAGHGPSVVVYPPVDVAAFPASSGDRVTLINLSADKGAATFYAVAERMPDLPFLGVKGGYGTQIVRELPNVEILDHVPSDRMRDEVYGRTRILMMPSAHESWGMTGVEAMASGIPVIAHPTDGLRESLGDAGIFVDRCDVDAWMTVIRRLQDKRRWNGASRRAKKRASELDPAPGLQRWCAAVENLARVPARLRRQLPVPVPA